jgi:hypothetical protein
VSTGPKITQAQAMAAMAKAMLARTTADDYKKKKDENDDVDYFEQPNINRVLAADGDDAIVAHGKIDDVLAALDKAKAPIVDIHPEKRMKAALAAFEEIRLPELQLEKPGLKRSQYKEMLWREFQKSDMNPCRDISKHH